MKIQVWLEDHERDLVHRCLTLACVEVSQEVNTSILPRKMACEFTVSQIEKVAIKFLPKSA